MAFKGIISRREGAVRFDLYVRSVALFGDCARCVHRGLLVAVIQRRRGPPGHTVLEQHSEICRGCLGPAEAWIKGRA